MTLSPWIARLGESSENAQLLEALSKAGASGVPTIGKDSVSERVQLKDAMLIFSSASLYPKFAEGGDGTSVLSGVLLPIKRKWGAYDGDLPYELKRDDSREKLRARFGAPVQSNATFRWDEWNLEDRQLRAEYTPDLAGLELVGVKLKD